MAVLTALVILIAVVLAVRRAHPLLRRWRMATALRGDWWSRFERELHQYERERLAARDRRG